MNIDELMEEIPMKHNAFFQFDDDKPIQFASLSGDELSITLKAQTKQDENPIIEFGDGNGKFFKIFLMPENGI